ncbi:MAG: geranylgeranyl reductase family protein [Candidatus Bipolaricaulota bacterium]
MQIYDVLVVGGGPIGAVAARSAAEAGAGVLLVERRSDVHGPALCTGLVSPRSLAVLGVSDACVLRRVTRVEVHGPRGAALRIAAADAKALVVDRLVMERELLARAAEVGVEVRLGAEAVSTEEGSVRLRSAEGEHREGFRVLIGADGPESHIAAWYGGMSLDVLARTAQVEAEAPTPEDEPVEVFLGRSVAPGFFAWKVPAEPGRLRVGVGVSGSEDPRPHLTRLLAERFGNARVLTRIEAPIPCPTLDRAAAGTAFLVGDAAGHVKPLSGGGLYFGALCARRAGHLAAAAAAGQDLREALRTYDAACRTLLGTEIRFGLAARRQFLSLDDGEADALLSALTHPALVALAAEATDLDYPSRVAAHVAAHPRAWGPLLRAWCILQSAPELASPDDEGAVRGSCGNL